MDMSKRKAHHLEELMAFVEMSHDQALALRYRAVTAKESAILAHRIYLEQSELILQRRNESESVERRSANQWTYGVQFARVVWPTILEYFIQALLYSR
jgi:hypothetical protein